MSSEVEEIKEVSNYYRDMVPTLISKYKHLVEQCFEIVDEPIDTELSSDKRHAELRSKRDAMTDAQFYAKQIDNLENVRNGVVSIAEDEAGVEIDGDPAKQINWAKRRAKKPN